jgi:hypothetical protein
MTGQLWVTAFTGALAGALVAALGTLYAGWLTRRHEHTRWVMEQRLEAYAAFNTAVAAWQHAYLNGGAGDRRLNPDGVPRDADALQHVVANRSRVLLVGERATSAQMLEVVQTVLSVFDHADPDSDDVVQALMELREQTIKLVIAQQFDILPRPPSPVHRLRARLRHWGHRWRRPGRAPEAG